MASVQKRVVIIGAGPNGLTAAWYLAKAGLTPLVLERRATLGNSPIRDHLPGRLLPQIARGLKVDRQKPELRLLALDSDGRAIRIYDDPQRTAKELETISPSDAKAYLEFHHSLARIGRLIGPLLSTTPPDIDHLKMGDYWTLSKFGLKFRALDKKDGYRLLRWATMPVADLVSDWFETDLLQAAIAARGIFGSFAGPRSAGTTIGLLLQAAIDGHPVSGPSFATLTEELARAASSAGAEIRTGAGVERIITKVGAVTGIALENGEKISASAVISSADPQHTFLKLVDPLELDPGFLSKIRNYRTAGVSAIVKLKLSGVPAFPELAPRIHIGPNIDYLERAFDAAKYGDFSSAPYMDIAMSQGGQVMSIYAQYAPYNLRNGDWSSRRDEFLEAVLRTLASHAPNLRDLIVHQEVITPIDLEQTYGLTGGHIFHGEHSLDQLFTFRPIIGWSQYRTPIRNLYMCGAGTHPGGGLTGAPAYNASREFLRAIGDKALRQGKNGV